MKIVRLTLLIFSIASTAALAQTNVVYDNNFQTNEVGKLPSDFISLNGEFAVQQDGTNKFLELPGAPLDMFAVMFGPVIDGEAAVKARIFGTAKGRREPTFGIGMGGVNGFRLQVAPGKKALEIYKDQDLMGSAPFVWKSGEWLWLQLQQRKTGNGGWKLVGKVWPEGSTPPEKWMIELDAKELPPKGKASVSGSPFSGLEIRFDDVKVETF